jgi:hypothetical protein
MYRSVEDGVVASAGFQTVPLPEKCIGFPEQKYISEAGKKGR